MSEQWIIMTIVILILVSAAAFLVYRLRPPKLSHTADDSQQKHTRNPAPAIMHTPVPTSARPAIDRAISWIDVELNFPAPIAFAARSYNCCAEEADPARKLLSLFALFEVALRYLCFVLSADWLANPQMTSLRGTRFPAWLKDLHTNRSLTLGEWVGVMRSLTEEVDAESMFIPEVYRLWHDPNLQTHIIQPFLQARNQFIHPDGSIVWSDEEIRDFLATGKPQLAIFLGQLAFLREYPLCVALDGSLFSAAPSQQLAANDYTLLRCMGAYGASWSRHPHITLTQLLQTGSPLLVKPDGSQILYLWPFLIEGESAHTQDNELYVFAHQTASGFRAAAYWAVRHREQVTRNWHSDSSGFAWFADQHTRQAGRITITAPQRLADGIQERKHQMEGKVIGISRPYTLKRRIGEGSMGTVYYAIDDRQRRYAVKIVHQHLPAALLRRFEREIRSMEVLRGHPNILLIVDWGVHSDQADNEYHYCVTEFAERGDLATYLDHHCPETVDGTDIPNLDSLAVRLHLIKQVITGVAEMHRQRFIHRDLKPSNALIMLDGSVRVADMGVVKLLDEDAGASMLTRRGSVVGTIGYMAPEQQLGRSDLVNEATDVFSLGIMLFQFIFGRLPRQDLMRNTDILLEQQALAVLPKSLRRLLVKSTKKEQRDRYEDAGILETALEAALREFLVGQVTFGLEPTGVIEAIDGNSIPAGQTLFTLAAGEHFVTVRFDGVDDLVQRRIRVKPCIEQQISLEAQLTRAVDDTAATMIVPHEALRVYLQRLDVSITFITTGYGVIETVRDGNALAIWHEMVALHGNDLLPQIVASLSTDEKDLQAKLVRLITLWGDTTSLATLIPIIHAHIIPRYPRPLKGLWTDFLLNNASDTPQQLLDILQRETDYQLKLSIPDALATCSDPALPLALISCLDLEADAGIRQAIIRALDVHAPGIIDALIRYLQTDESWQVRVASAYVLGESMHPTAFTPLLETIRHDTDADVRTSAVIALLRLDHAQAQTALRVMITEQDPVIIGSLRKAFTEADEPVLLAELRLVEEQLESMALYES